MNRSLSDSQIAAKPLEYHTEKKKKKKTKCKKERNNALTSEHPTIRGPSFRFLHYQRQVEPVMIKAVEGLSPIIFQHFGHFRLNGYTWHYTFYGRLEYVDDL